MEVKETAMKYEYYTYADYAEWDDGNRYELIDGVPYMMSSPSLAHQEILVELVGQLRELLKGKPCKVLMAPFDVCLNAAGDRDNTVVQPDLMVICDKSKLDGKRCDGAPDMVAEILSPSNPNHDRVKKFNKYLQAGIREYWIVDPTNKVISAHILKNGEYVVKSYSSDEAETIPVHVLDGCTIDLMDIFAE
jgi:Uma2 family endonuclease